MSKPTAVVCAYSSVGTAALEGLLEAGVEVKALYTYPQGADEQWFTPPATVAQAQGIPVHMAPAFNDDQVYDAIRAQRPGFLFSFYFREMIQARFLEIPRLGAYNLHGSLLPKYRGRAPLNWVLVKGETETGVTLHAMTPKPDDGVIVAQTRRPEDPRALHLLRRSQARRLPAGLRHDRRRGLQPDPRRGRSLAQRLPRDPRRDRQDRLGPPQCRVLSGGPFPPHRRRRPPGIRGRCLEDPHPQGSGAEDGAAQ